MKITTFEDYCQYNCDGLFNPYFSEEEQCSGYIMLKKMVIENITPASLTEIKRWEIAPSLEELKSIPDIKYLRFLHPLLRTHVMKNWKTIKSLKIN